MSEKSVVHIGENSPQQVAYKLLHIVAKGEGKNISHTSTAVDRKWLLDAYAECLQATMGNRYWQDE